MNLNNKDDNWEIKTVKSDNGIIKIYLNQKPKGKFRSFMEWLIILREFIVTLGWVIIATVIIYIGFLLSNIYQGMQNLPENIRTGLVDNVNKGFEDTKKGVSKTIKDNKLDSKFKDTTDSIGKGIDDLLKGSSNKK